MNKVISLALSIALLNFSCNKNEINQPEESVTASFKINNASGEVEEGSSLMLSNTSSGMASYKWDFGNGITSFEKEPSYIYPHCGIYTIKLTATDVKGNIYTAAKELYVTCVFSNVNHPPLF
ncbi:MAG: PKD domain-containing protein [Chitinophagaceae bacterium]